LSEGNPIFPYSAVDLDTDKVEIDETILDRANQKWGLICDATLPNPVHPTKATRFERLNLTFKAQDQLRLM
jgi:hypothetical protein